MPSPEVSQPINFAEKIKQYLRDATEQRVQQFAIEVQRLIQVKNYGSSGYALINLPYERCSKPFSH